jgi:hypothetical protein
MSLYASTPPTAMHSFAQDMQAIWPCLASWLMLTPVYTWPLIGSNFVGLQRRFEKFSDPSSAHSPDDGTSPSSNQWWQSVGILQEEQQQRQHQQQ